MRCHVNNVSFSQNSVNFVRACVTSHSVWGDWKHIVFFLLSFVSFLWLHVVLTTYEMELPIEHSYCSSIQNGTDLGTIEQCGYGIVLNHNQLTLCSLELVVSE